MLASFNVQLITYDAIGNPTSYLGKTLTWMMGRQLESLTDANNSIQYKYNSDGIRTQKTVNGAARNYRLLGDKVTMEQTGSQTPIYYAYDSAGKLFLICYEGQNYFYARNAQNDVIGLVDASDNWVVEYTYDAWGNPTSISGALANTLGQANPYRYRGYRYDTETGLYYLQSRYYDPEWGRFINADDSTILTSQNDILGHNLYAYCTNNPINHVDDAGYWKKSTWTAIGICAGIALCIVIIVASGGIGAGPLAAAFAGGGISVSASSAAGAAAMVTTGKVVVGAVGAAAAGYIGSQIGKNSINKASSNSGSSSNNKNRKYISENKTPKNNQAQNKSFSDVIKKLKLNKDQARRLHDTISGEGFDYHEIMNVAKNLFSR